MKPFRTLITLFALLGCSLSVCAADPTVVDLEASKAGAWKHASGKPVDVTADPLNVQTDPVSVVPPQLQVFSHEVKTPATATSLSFECQAYLENGNFQGGLVTSRAGDQRGKGYFFSIEAKAKAVTIGMRGGYAGPWEWFSKTSVTRPDGWAKIKFTWYRDGTLQLYINDELYLEKEDLRLRQEVDQIQIQTNGEGKKYLSNASLIIEP